MATPAATRQAPGTALLARDRRSARPAAAAARRAFRASLLIGLFGLASAAFVIARLLASWRVTAGSTAHHLSIFGQTLSYPAANIGAIVIAALAALGLVAALVALYGVARELAAARRFQRRLSRQQRELVNGVCVIDDRWPQAFVAGLVRPRVYVSTATLALLGERELEAVLAHERHHAWRRDPLRLATGRVLDRALFFLPALAGLISQQQALAELGADEAAVAEAPAHRSALASAMLSFADADAGAEGRAHGVGLARVDYLLGRPLNWRFPLAVALVPAVLIGLVVAVAVLAGQAASGSATLSPPFLSAQPCVVVLAMLPAALGLIAAIVGQRRARPALRARAQRPRR